MELRCVSITVNYPEYEVEANVPQVMSIDQLCEAIRKLINDEKDMISFVVAAAIRR